MTAAAALVAATNQSVSIDAGIDTVNPCLPTVVATVSRLLPLLSMSFRRSLVMVGGLFCFVHMADVTVCVCDRQVRR